MKNICKINTLWSSQSNPKLWRGRCRVLPESQETRDRHWAPTPTPTPIRAHAHGFWVGMGAILLFMGGHGCDMGGHRSCMCGHGWAWVQFKSKMSVPARNVSLFLLHPILISLVEALAMQKLTMLNHAH